MTKIRKVYLLICGASLIFSQMYYGFAAETICYTATFIYPTYRTIMAIESPDSDESKTKWLAYWIIYFSVTIFERVLDFILASAPPMKHLFIVIFQLLTFVSQWIPFYHCSKLLFLLWALSPKTNGPSSFYDSVIKRMFKRSESKVDAVLDDARRLAGAAVLDLLVLDNDKSNIAQIPEDQESTSICDCDTVINVDTMKSRTASGSNINESIADGVRSSIIVVRTSSNIRTNAIIDTKTNNDGGRCNKKTKARRKKISWMDKRNRQTELVQ